MKAAILALALLALPAAGCASLTGSTGQVVLKADQADTAARVLQKEAANDIAAAHASGVLTGATFNKAKADEHAVEVYLEKGEALLAAGNTAAAADTINAALALLAGLQAAAHGA